MSGLLGAALTLSAGYLGGFVTHPGVFVAVERPLVDQDRLVVGGRLGATHHFRSHTAGFVQAELGTRWGGPQGLFVEGFGGVGYEHRWLAGRVYVEDDGGVRRGVDLGRPGWRLSGALGTGWSRSPTRRGPRRVFARAEGWLTWVGFRRSVPGVGLSLGATLGARP